MIQAIITRDDEVRLLICTGFIAAAIGAFDVLPDDIASIMLKTTFAVSGVAAFGYLMLTAAKLKYKEQDSIDIFLYSEKFRQNTYDISINIFGINLNLLLIYGLAGVLGWHFNDGFIDWRIGLGAVLSVAVTYMLLRNARREKK